MRSSIRIAVILLILCFIGGLFADEWADDPYIIKMENRARKESGTSNKIIVTDPSQTRTPNITEKIIANGFKRYELPEPREFPNEAAAFLPELPPRAIEFRPARTTPPSARPSPPSPDEPGEGLDFRATDVLVSIPNARPQRQSH